MNRLLCLATAIAACTLAQGETARDADADKGVVDLPARLQALTPSDPMGYFELGEEVAYEVPGPAGRKLAETLFVLAFELDRRLGSPESLGRSACLALADIAPDPDDRQWLSALAGVAGTVEGADDAPSGAASFDEESAHLFCEMLEGYRAERFRESRERLSRQDVRTIYEKYKEALRKAGFSEQELKTHPSCPECRNRRVSNPGSNDRPLVPCSRCGGNPGPALSDVEFIRQIVLQAKVLDVEHTKWSAQLQMDFGEPLRDLDPRELAAWYRVDLDKVLWRPVDAGPWPGGRWIVNPAAPENQQPAAQ